MRIGLFEIPTGREADAFPPPPPPALSNSPGESKHSGAVVSLSLSIREGGEGDGTSQSQATSAAGVLLLDHSTLEALPLPLWGSLCHMHASSSEQGPALRDGPGTPTPTSGLIVG